MYWIMFFTLHFRHVAKIWKSSVSVSCPCSLHITMMVLENVSVGPHTHLWLLSGRQFGIGVDSGFLVCSLNDVMIGVVTVFAVSYVCLYGCNKNGCLLWC